MYADFYGLTGRPFDLTPDPRFLLLTPKHREALSVTDYVLSGSAGLAVLIGEAGTGKTTLLRAALQDPRRKGTSVVMLDNPTLTRDEFFEFLADGFELGVKAAGSKTRVLRELNRVLAARGGNGTAATLIVDEAQSLSDELLEEIRLLANIETPQAKLLSILLAGQPELAQRLNEPGLRQLKQRIAVRGVLSPLTLAETAEYVAGRVRILGGDAATIFTGRAVQEVYAHSGGIPRTVSVICENALVAGYALGVRPIDRDVVLEVCRELDLLPVVEPLFSVPTPSAGAEEPVSPPAPTPAPTAAEAIAAPVPPAIVPSAATLTAPESAPPAVPAIAPPAARRSGEAEPPAGRPRVRLLDRLSFWKRRGSAPMRLETRYFDVDGRAGVLIAPAADNGRAVKS